jgi:hypothetical protein
MVPNLPLWKTNFHFFVGVLQKFLYDGHKSIIGKWIPVQLDPDLIGENQILERLMAVRNQFGSEL